MIPGKALLSGLLLAAPALFAQPVKTITLNVIARDSHDHPVAGLGRDDFEVTDQGKTQHITVYGPEQRRQLLTPPGSDAQGNGPVPHIVVILFDLLNANLGYRGYGTDEIEHALQKLDSGDSLYLYLLTSTGALYPVRGLPGPDANISGSQNDSWTQQIKPRLEGALREVFGFKPVDDQVPAIRVETTYRAVDTLAAAIAPLPGRKDVIWLTHGVPIAVPQINLEPFDFEPRLRQLATKIDRAGIAIDTVDQGDALATGSKQTIEEFAEVTGGKAYPSGTFDKALSEVLEAPKGAYRIEYPAPVPDGKYHKVRVSASRKGIHLQAEQGYFASR